MYQTKNLNHFKCMLKILSTTEQSNLMLNVAILELKIQGI